MLSGEKLKMSNEVQEKVYKLFAQLNIPYEVVEHEALLSQADNEKNPRNIDGVILKNLFIRNKAKNKYYLYVLPLEKRADLKELSDCLGNSRFSFGNDVELEAKLGIRPGSVSLLNIIGVETTDVTFVIDREVYDHDRISLHPNDNTASMIFSPDVMTTILDHYNAKYILV